MSTIKKQLDSEQKEHAKVQSTVKDKNRSLFRAVEKLLNRQENLNVAINTYFAIYNNRKLTSTMLNNLLSMANTLILIYRNNNTLSLFKDQKENITLAILLHNNINFFEDREYVNKHNPKDISHIVAFCNNSNNNMNVIP